MSETTDLWFLRLPDGRVFRAAGTAVLRQQLSSGRIPPATRLRRSPDDEWRAYERFKEFSDLAPPSPKEASRSDSHADARDGAANSGTIASRLDPTQLRQVGVRGLMEELLAALDSTAVRLKLRIALWSGLLAGAMASMLSSPLFSFEIVPLGLGWLPALGLLVLVLWLSGVLSQLSFNELSRLRPARWADGARGLTALTCRLVFLQGGGWCVLTCVILLCRWLPGYMLAALGDETSSAVLIGIEASAAACMLLEAGAWMLALLLLPIAPLLVVEGCSSTAAMKKWLFLVRRHIGQLLLAEGMALGIGLLLSGPAGLIVWILHMHVPDARLVSAAGFARALVAGMAGSLLLAYLVVANVFIYLHLHYETHGQR